MKSHISVTIDQDLAERVNRFGQEERRSRSQIIEMALEEFLGKRGGADQDLVTSPGKFVGTFSREDTYELG
jgi:metal-responsive CopG/Arc/MetJ family transcriptional regulator